MFIVKLTGFSGSVVDIQALCEGEMLDRVRLAMKSEYIKDVTVSKEEVNGTV